VAKANWKKPQMFQDESVEVRFANAIKVSDLKNLGPSSEASFAKAGIKSAAQLRKIGWQKAMQLLIKVNPKNNHSIFAYAIIGALENVEWNRISDDQKKQAQDFCKLLREKFLAAKKTSKKNRLVKNEL